jgi:capsular polysaccharide biosynthesis protein
MTLNEQILTFNNAEVVVAQSGAALTSLLFCKRKVSVIELKPFAVRNIVFWETFSQILGINHAVILSEKRRLDGCSSKRHTVKFDINSIKSTLLHHLRVS